MTDLMPLLEKAFLLLIISIVLVESICWAWRVWKEVLK